MMESVVIPYTLKNENDKFWFLLEYKENSFITDDSFIRIGPNDTVIDDKIHKGTLDY